VRYRNWSIYWLYDTKSDSIIVSKSVDFNKDLLTNENIKNNSITNQNSISETEFFTEFFNEDNKKIFNSSDSMSESMKNKAKVKKSVMKISSSWEKMSIMRCKRLKKQYLWIKWFYWSKFLNKKNSFIKNLNC